MIQEGEDDTRLDYLTQRTARMRNVTCKELAEQPMGERVAQTQRESIPKKKIGTIKMESVLALAAVIGPEVQPSRARWYIG